MIRGRGWIRGMPERVQRNGKMDGDPVRIQT